MPSVVLILILVIAYIVIVTLILGVFRLVKRSDDKWTEISDKRRNDHDDE